MTPRKFYLGNYPNSSDYDPNVPIGFNRWDAEDFTEEAEISEENTESDNETDKNACLEPQEVQG